MLDAFGFNSPGIQIRLDLVPIASDGSIEDLRKVQEYNSVNPIFLAAVSLAILGALPAAAADAPTGEGLLCATATDEDNAVSSGNAYKVAAEQGAGSVKKSGQPDLQDIIAVLPSLAMVILGLILLYRLAKSVRTEAETKKGDSDK